MEGERRGGGGREERRGRGRKHECGPAGGSGGTEGGRRGGGEMRGWYSEKTVVDTERNGVRGGRKGARK